MTGKLRQRTRLELAQRRVGGVVLTQVRRNWRSGSLALLGLLVGYFLSQNLMAVLIMRVPGGRPVVVLALVLLVEAIVRLRSQMVQNEPPLAWVIADNLRLGAIYAVVLEAFKLGT
jgi:Protein of unknown function (DUF565)